MTLYSFTPTSRNGKTGPMPIVTASRDTCPPDCSLMGNGCYAENWPLSLRWDELEHDGLTFDEMASKVRRLRAGTLWRYGQAGDHPNLDDEVRTLARANRGKDVIIYTHKRKFDLYHECADMGLHFNLSASSVAEADRLMGKGLPVVAVLPSSYARNNKETLTDYRERIGGSFSFTTPDGNHVAICPATYTDTNCSLCGVCAKPRNGDVIIGFPGHGNRKKLIDNQLGSGVWTKNSLSPWRRSLKISPSK